MNTFRTSVLTALVLAASLPALADTQTVDRVGKPAKIRCGVWTDGSAIYAEHADKIIFHLTGTPVAINPADQGPIMAIPRNSKLDIKVLDDPTTIADLKGKVLSFIGAIDNQTQRDLVVIDEVAYAMVCPVRPGATTP